MKKKCPHLWIVFLLSAPAFAQINFHPHLHGIHGSELENAKSRLKILEESLDSEKDRQKKVTYFLKQSPKEIKKALEPFGYFDATVQTTFHHDKDDWVIDYQINPGPPVIVESVDLTVIGPGAQEPYFQEARIQLPIQSNSRLQTEHYQESKTYLFQLAMDHGYLTNTFTVNQLLIDRLHHRATVRLALETGPQYTFGQVHFQKTLLADSFLNRFIQFKPGEPYNNAVLQQLQENLDNSGYFQQVIVTPELPNHETLDILTPSSPSHTQVPVEIELTPKNRFNYSMSVGYGTNTNLRSKVSMEVPLLNARGHQFNTEFLASRIVAHQTPKNLSLSARYRIPGHNPIDELYTFSGLLKKTEFTSNLLTNKSYTGSLAAAYSLTHRAWQPTLTLSLLHERFMIEDIPTQVSTILTPSVQWLHLHSDHPLYPTHGHVVNLSIRGSHSLITANRDFFQGQAYVKGLKTLSTTHRLIATGTAAFTLTPNIYNMPLTYQLFAGGTDSVRGYRFNALGPGRYLASVNLEWQHQIVGDWYHTLFFDMGEVYATTRDLKQAFKTRNMHRGIGLSLLWRSPIGDLQLSYTKPLDGTAHERQRWQFNMGPEL